MRVALALLGALGGALLGGLAAFFGGIAIGEIFQVSQFEGAYAMGVAFFWTPAGMLAGAVLGVILALRLTRPAP